MSEKTLKERLDEMSDREILEFIALYIDRIAGGLNSLFGDSRDILREIKRTNKSKKDTKIEQKTE